MKALKKIQMISSSSPVLTDRLLQMLPKQTSVDKYIYFLSRRLFTTELSKFNHRLKGPVMLKDEKTGLVSDRMLVLLRVCGVLLLNDQNLKNAALFLFPSVSLVSVWDKSDTTLEFFLKKKTFEK